jgi:hypothetical protein
MSIGADRRPPKAGWLLPEVLGRTRLPWQFNCASGVCNRLSGLTLVVFGALQSMPLAVCSCTGIFHAEDDDEYRGLSFETIVKTINACLSRHGASLAKHSNRCQLLGGHVYMLENIQQRLHGRVHLPSDVLLGKGGRQVSAVAAAAP